jgi:hypothetical protein
MAHRSTNSRVRDQHEALHHPAPKPRTVTRKSDRTSHEGATEDRVGDRTGPEAGYDDEPAKVKDRGGVS